MEDVVIGRATTYSPWQLIREAVCAAVVGLRRDKGLQDAAAGDELPAVQPQRRRDDRLPGFVGHVAGDDAVLEHADGDVADALVIRERQRARSDRTDASGRTAFGIAGLRHESRRSCRA